jgi:hypothetical protein
MSHSADRLIGATTHHSPQPQPLPMYGNPQYLPAYGGMFYYPPPPYIHPPIPNYGAPSTSSYSTSESTAPSYVPYGSIPPQNP